MIPFKRRLKTIFPHRDSKIFKQHYWTWQALVKAMKDRLVEEKDVFCLVSGDTGSGKSHFIGNLCLKHFSKEENFVKNEGMMFDKENFIIDPEEFAVKMITQTGSVIWADEGRRAADRQQWFSKLSQTIINRKNQNRKNFNIYFMLMPYEREFNPKLASHLTLWFWVRRGVVEIYCKSSGKKGGKGLNIQEILDREEKWFKENPKANFCIPFIHPEYIGRINFKALTAGYKKEYDELVKDKQAIGELSEEEKEKFGIIESLSSEAIINKSIDMIKDGGINSRRQLWNHLKEKTDLPDDKLLKQLNFYLQLEGFSTFAKLFDKSKIATGADLF